MKMPQFTMKSPTDMSIAIRERGLEIRRAAEALADYATVLDIIGDAEDHPEDSEKRQLAELRDEADLILSHTFTSLYSLVRVRAMTSRSVDLLVDAACHARGDGHEALELMERFYTVFGDERGEDGEVPPETFPDTYLWDVYYRVSALKSLAERFPDHMRHAARQMRGWPMIVSHHLDNTCEFERIAELLHLGAGYPLDTAPRRKRGGPTPLHDYLAPLVWKLHVLQIILAESEKLRGGEEFSSRIKYFWWSPPDSPPHEEILEILRKVPSLPPFSKSSATEWSKHVIVPYISATDGVDPANSSIPLIRSVWAHRSVKSQATFESHLHSAITGFLTRYGRSE